MSTITKEQAHAISNLKAGYTLGHADVAILNELARIALASLEAEPVGFRIRLKAPFNFGERWDYIEHRTPDRFELENCDIERLYTAPPAPVSAPDYPETLPYPVMLESGLRFGKGVPTKTMLGALQRGAGYYAALEAMTPEERAEHDAGMKEFAAMLQGAKNAEWLRGIQAAPALNSSPNNGKSPSSISPVIPDRWEKCKHLLPIGELIHRLEEQTGDHFSDDPLGNSPLITPRNAAKRLSVDAEVIAIRTESEITSFPVAFPAAASSITDPHQ